MPCPLAMPVFSAPLVEMQALDFLPQSLEFSFSEVLREVTCLENNLASPTAGGHLAEAVQSKSA
ncbi:MAG TPA: hypothetical protein VLS96_03120 [Nodosilinea sp.]|nr:hypothetical protein [Nodosilinea sp.]